MTDANQKQQNVALIDLSEYNFDKEALSSEELLQDLTCLLCYGVAINPLKCATCE